MMNIVEQINLDIAPDGIIQILKQEVLIKDDGTEVVLQNWRTTVAPGEFDKIDKLQLADYHLNIIQAAWTSEVIESYQRKQDEQEEKRTTEMSGF